MSRRRLAINPEGGFTPSDTEMDFECMGAKCQGSLLGALAPIAGGLLGFMGSENSNDAQLEMAQMARELPPWLQPYMTGPAGPEPEPIPINYNWMDAIYQAANSGMPQDIPPMSMNDPRMTMENVYQPDPGGFHGYGTPPDGMQPQQQAAPPEQGGLMSQEMLDMARRYQSWKTMQNSMSNGGGNGPMGALEALSWAQQNSDTTDPTALMRAMYGSP